MKRDLIEKERQLYKSSLELRNLDLTNVDFKISEDIRRKQDEDYNKYLFFKGYLGQLEKEQEKERKQTNWGKYKVTRRKESIRKRYWSFG